MLAQVGKRDLFAVTRIDAEDDEALTLELFVDAFETTSRLATRGSTSAPDVEPHDLAAVIGQAYPAAVD